MFLFHQFFRLLIWSCIFDQIIILPFLEKGRKILNILICVLNQREKSKSFEKRSVIIHVEK